MSTAPFLSRHLGDYLLVAQLSEDALGTVFRALYAPDERRFVRLRLLQSEELRDEQVLAAIRDYGSREPIPRHDAIVRRPQLDLVEGFPILTWDEISGWTLDGMLARVRALGIRIPAEYALLIAERIAAGLEHVHLCEAGGYPPAHGLLWPGFVAIAHDASVRIGGFGIGPAARCSLSAPRLAEEIAPYVAPEARNGGIAGPSADVYSLGAILVELLTGRRPSPETPSAELRAGDPRSEDLGAFLRRCLACPEQRFASAVDAHRTLQQLVTGNPFSLYTANLALFLYKLLNPESQSLAPSSDWESTNPVFIERSLRATPAESRSMTPERTGLRRGDAAESPEVAAGDPLRPVCSSEQPKATPAATSPEGSANWIAPSRWPDIATSWKRPVLGLAAAAGLGLGVFLIASQLPARRPVPKVVPLSPSGALSSLTAPATNPVAVSDTAASANGFSDLPRAGSRPPALSGSPPRPASKVRPERRQRAEDQRLRAALARIEADRVNAREKAADIFDEGRLSEQEGVRLLRQRDYDAAQLAFSRAAELFRRAREATWEERVHETRLSANP